MAPATKTAHLNIGGMTCVACQNRIERKLRGMEGVTSVSVNYDSASADITYNAAVLSMKDIAAAIAQLGYEVSDPQTGKEPAASRTVGLLLIIAALFIVLNQFGVLNMLAPGRLADNATGYGMLFLIGLITSVHCVAMCGGIHLSQSLQNIAAEGKWAAFRPALLYNLGRVGSYTIIGGVLGLVGWLIGGDSGAGLPLLLQGGLKLLAGAFMIIMGINMLGLFPKLRRLQPRMPKVFARKIGGEAARSKSPLIVGLLNGLMPCGPLQSMQLVALAAGAGGRPWAGALAMFLFGMGTVPLMLGLGSVVAALGKKYTKKVMTAGAVLVVVLGLAMLSQGWSLTGFQLPSFASQSDIQPPGDGMELINGVQVVRSQLDPRQYPNITVRAGTPVKWIINAAQGSINGCNGRLNIPAFGIRNFAFQPGENVIEFTPGDPGTFSYSCWMGMIHGAITVTD